MYASVSWFELFLNFIKLGFLDSKQHRPLLIYIMYELYTHFKRFPFYLTHSFLIVEHQDVMNIEKAYWGLKGSSGKFDEDVLLSIMSPPLPERLCKS